MLVEKLEHDGVQAVPVFGGREEFTRVKNELGQVEEAVTTEIMQRLPVPDYDTPLENLVRLRQKPAFRDALGPRRCIIPATRFYEWRRNGTARIPFSIHRADGAPMSYAGLWNV